MAALDTNVLVRYLVQDDKAQLAAASKLIQSALAAGETLFIPITVTLELEWVLRSCFQFSKQQVTNTLSSLFATTELKFESESVAEICLELYKKSNADFSDCMHIALAHTADQKPLWTFDRAAAKVAGAKLLA